MRHEHGISPVIYSCSVLRDELISIQHEDFPDISLHFLDSMLHMKPEQLAKELEKILSAEDEQHRQVILVYGDCCARMESFEQRDGVIRTPGANCGELLLGKEEYRRLMKEGAFLLLPEWTCRWREIFSQELGLNQENAQMMMQDMHRTLVYLDTGIVPVPQQCLIDCSEYCGLPWQILPVSRDTLRQTLQSTINRFPATEQS